MAKKDRAVDPKMLSATDAQVKQMLAEGEAWCRSVRADSSVSEAAAAVAVNKLGITVAVFLDKFYAFGFVFNDQPELLEPGRLTEELNAAMGKALLTGTTGTLAEFLEKEIAKEEAAEKK